MIEPGRNFTTNIYRYGFNGKEKDDEIKGSGNSYDFEFRQYDPRLGRFMSIDPLASQYAGWTPYSYAQDRPIDGIDFEGLEYVSAANWAENNLFGWKFGSRGWYYSFNNYRQPSTVLKMNNEVYCYESVLLSCAQANGIVAEYLSLEGMPLNRAEAMDWFKRGGKYHSFIDKDYSQVKRGDILFKGLLTEGGGHAAIAAGAPVFSEDKKSFTIEVYSTNTEPSNEYGTKSYTFIKNNKGEWYAADQKLSGFGRIDEQGILSGQQPASNTTFDVKSILKTLQAPLFKFEFHGRSSSQTGGTPRFTPSTPEGGDNGSHVNPRFLGGGGTGGGTQTGGGDE